MNIKITVNVTIKDQDLELSFDDAKQLYNQLQPLFQNQFPRDYFKEWDKMKWVKSPEFKDHFWAKQILCNG